MLQHLSIFLMLQSLWIIIFFFSFSSADGFYRTLDWFGMFQYCTEKSKDSTKPPKTTKVQIKSKDEVYFQFLVQRCVKSDCSTTLYLCYNVQLFNCFLPTVFMEHFTQRRFSANLKAFVKPLNGNKIEDCRKIAKKCKLSFFAVQKSN